MSELNSNLVYLATGVDGLDQEVKEKLSLKNVVTKEIYYTDILISDEMKAGTVILSRRLEGKISLTDVIKGLRKKGARVIYCVPKDWTAFEICLECGVYDLLEDPIFSSNIIEVFENPMSYKDILDIKSKYNQYMEVMGKKIDTSKILKQKGSTEIKKAEIDTLKINTPKTEKKIVEQMDIDGLFEGLSEDNLVNVDTKNIDEKKVTPSEKSEHILNISEKSDNKGEFSKECKKENEIKSDENKLSESVMNIGKEEEPQEEEPQEKEFQIGDEKVLKDSKEKILKEYTISEEEKGKKRSFDFKLPSFNVDEIKIKTVFNKMKIKTESENQDKLMQSEGKIVKENIFFTSKKYKIPKTISVIGSELGVGTTYVSMLLAFSLGQKKNVLYVVVDELLFKSMTIMENVVTYPFDYTFVNDELYKKYNDYDHIIYDCDQMLNNIGHNLFYTSQRKIIMTSLLPYKMSFQASMDAAAYVDIIGVLGLKTDDVILKGIEVRENFEDKDYLSKMQKKLLGDYDE